MVRLRSAVALACLLAPCAAWASAPPRPQALGAIGEYGEFGAPAVALGADGRAVGLTVAADGSLQRRRAGTTQRFGPAVAVPDGDHARGYGAVVGRGFALITWLRDDGSHPPVGGYPGCCRRLRTTVVPADGRMRRARELSAPGGEVLDATAAARGDRAVVAWRDGLGLRMATARADGSIGAPRTILRTPPELLGLDLRRRVPHALGLIVAPAMRVVEVWRPPGDRGHVRALGALPRGLGVTAVAATSAGGLLLAATDVPRRGPPVAAIVLRRPGRRLVVRRIAAPAPVGLIAATVALGPDGRGLLAYATRHRVHLRPVSAAGRVGRGRTVRFPGQFPILAIALGRGGRGVLAVRTEDPARRPQGTLIAWPLRASGATGRPRTLAHGRAIYAVSAVAAAGRARVSWRTAHTRFSAAVAVSG